MEYISIAKIYLFFRSTCRRMQSFYCRWTTNWSCASRCYEGNIKLSSSECVFDLFFNNINLCIYIYCNIDLKVFQVHPEYVQLNPAFRDYAERSARVDEVLREWKADEKFVTLRGWREECYEVRAQFNTLPLFKMDRSATCMYKKKIDYLFIYYLIKNWKNH